MAGIDLELLKQIQDAMKAELTIDKEIARLKKRIEEKKQEKADGSKLLKTHKDVVEQLKKTPVKSATKSTAGGTKAKKIDETDRLTAVKATIAELKQEGTKEIKSSAFYGKCNEKLERSKSLDSVFYKEAIAACSIKTSGQKAGLKFHIG